jgi:hypothetical protein
MKKINGIFLFCVFFLAVIILSGCSYNEQKRFSQREGFQGMSNRAINITEEQRQQLFEERQRQAIEVCQGKNEGDSCIYESPRGEIQGACKIMNNSLACTTNRPMRQG